MSFFKRVKEMIKTLGDSGVTGQDNIPSFEVAIAGVEMTPQQKKALEMSRASVEVQAKGLGEEKKQPTNKIKVPPFTSQPVEKEIQRGQDRGRE